MLGRTSLAALVLLTPLAFVSPFVVAATTETRTFELSGEGLVWRYDFFVPEPQRADAATFEVKASVTESVDPDPPGLRWIDGTGLARITVGDDSYSGPVAIRSWTTDTDAGLHYGLRVMGYPDGPRFDLEARLLRVGPDLGGVTYIGLESEAGPDWYGDGTATGRIE